MLNAFLWGLIASSSLLIGGLLGIKLSLSKRVLGAIMAFGAGTLISTVAYELILGSVKISLGTGATAAGFLGGAAVFFLCDRGVEKLGVSYPYSESLTFGFDYIYEKFSSSDWHLDDVEPNTIPNLLALGANAWNYDTSVLYFNVRYQLQ
jgi:zinc transporter ZupT